MGISFIFHPNSNTLITTRFCTWDDSYAIVAYEKFCGDVMARNADIGPDDGLSPNRQFTIIGRNDGLTYWRKDVLLGLDELIK